jgi:hypothetical protein
MLVVVLAAELRDRWALSCASAYLALWDAHQRRERQAQGHSAIAARLAEEENDDWLRSLAGLAMTWIALQRGEYHDALATLQPLRDLSFDPQQRQMIGIYFSLTHYVLEHWQDAAAASIDVIDMSLRTRGLRSTAAAIEIAGYLGMRMGRPEICPAFLGKAADIRERTHSPLFSFWIAHNDEATNWARARLGPDRFYALHRAGAAARDEIVIDETRALLCEIAQVQEAAAGAGSPSRKGANSPSGS